MRVESVRIFQRWDYVAFATLSLLALAIGINFFSYWLTLDVWSEHPFALSCLTLLMCVVLGIRVVSWCLLPAMRRPVVMPAPSGLKVGVVTTFVPGAESIDMLRHTLDGLVRMDYAHDTWVLDEGDSPEVRALCEELGAYHFSRKHLPQYQAEAGRFQSKTKFGNVNAWLDSVGFERYEFVSAFDPDHIPKANFLERVLGFFRDPTVGYVQAAQVYHNQGASFIARGAAEETYDYYSTLQMTSYSFGYPVVTGCHNTHRVSALREVGGFSPHDADDLLITLYYRVKGWRGVYVPEVLAEGLTPVDWPGYLKQQRRWARSVLDIKLRIFPKLANQLPIETRAFSFLHGLSYLTEGLLPFLSLLLLVYLLAVSKVSVIGNLLVPSFYIFVASLQVNDFFRQRFFLQPRKEFGLHWRAGVLRYAKWPQVLAATYDVALNRVVPYVLTTKQGTKRRQIVMLWPHLFSAVILCLAWSAGAIGHDGTDRYVAVWATVMIAGCLALFMSQFSRFPQPFDPELLDYGISGNSESGRFARSTSPVSQRS